MKQICVTEKDLNQVESFIENYIVDAMNKEGLSFGAMAFTIQTILDGIMKAKKNMKESDANE